MSENPTTLFPDYRLDWDIVGEDAYVTEILTARSQVEQRHTVGAARTHWTASTEIRTQAERKIIRDFIAARKGSYEAFSWWRPPEDLGSAAVPYFVGAVVASTTITIPVKGPWWINDTAIPGSITAVYIDSGSGYVSAGFGVVTPNVDSYGRDRIDLVFSRTGNVAIVGTNLRPLATARFDARAARYALVPRIANPMFVFPLAIQELIP